MATCCDCKHFYPIEDNPERGDCVRREVDPRQAYYTAREMDAAMEASGCKHFEQK
jgi:benzylsuccinate synthase